MTHALSIDEFILMPDFEYVDDHVAIPWEKQETQQLSPLT
jgi:hypothetical protein